MLLYLKWLTTTIYRVDNQCERLIEIIRNLTLSKTSIAEGMVFCLNHLTALKDSLDIIVDSLCQTTTKPVSKIARSVFASPTHQIKKILKLVDCFYCLTC